MMYRFRLPADCGVSLPVGILALLVGFSGAFLSLSALDVGSRPHPTAGAAALALAQTGIDHACGILVRRAAELDLAADARERLGTGAGAGVLPELGEETAVRDADGDGRRAYRVRVRIEPPAPGAAPTDPGAVRITCVGLLRHGEEDDPAAGVTVRVLEAVLHITPSEPGKAGAIHLARR